MSRPIPPSYKTKNWPAYNASLDRPGSLTIWFDPEMVWVPPPTGKRGRYPRVRALLSGLPNADWLLGDRGYDADWFREALVGKKITPCIPGRKSREKPVKYDKRRYRKRKGEAWTANGAVGTWSAYPSRRSRQRATHRFSRRASHHDLRPSRPTKRVMQRGIEMECTEDRSRSSLCVPDPLVDECLIVFDARLVDVSRVFLPVFLEHGRRDPFENSF